MRIFYFSGTGNSLHVSKQIAKEFDNAQIIPISNFSNQQEVVIDDDSIGFVFPCYCQDMPDNLIYFCKKLVFKTQPYIFGIVTHNGEPSTTLISLGKLLEGKSQNLHVGYALLMPGNSLHFYDYTNPKEEQAERLQNVEVRLEKEVVPAIINRTTNEIEHTPGFKYRINRQINYNFLYVFYKTHKRFYSDAKCTGCGSCEKVCSLQNITVTNKKAVWGNNCIQCVACLHWCPSRSIQIKGKTEDKQRYHHPKIELKEMFCQSSV